MIYHHIGLEVRDTKATKEFYSKLPGFAEGEMMIFEEKAIEFIFLGSLRMEIIESGCPDPLDNRIHICLEVEDLESTMKTLEKAGLELAEGPYQLDNGWRTAFYEGPDGETLEFLQTVNGKKLSL